MFLCLVAALLSLISMNAAAAPPSLESIQRSMDTIWVVTAGALVFFMQAGFALLEGGMVRSKNTVNVVMKNYTDMCFGALVFWMFGYGLMFGANPSGWIGTDHFFLGGEETNPKEFTMLFFQTMFAATAATIVSGALAERARFSAYVVVSIFITTFVYAIYGSWVWGSLYEGSGWLREMGFIDFAGSTVVHSVGGWCALAGIIVLGPRLGKYDPDTGKPRDIPGHNLPMVALGGFILWLGWFGFNGGSTLSASVDIGKIILNTHLSASAGVAGSIMLLLMLGKPVLMTNTINAGLAGLVGITAGCAVMDPMYAVITGLISGMVLVVSTQFMEAMRWDDPVGAVSVHGTCGAWGTLAAGIFNSENLFDIDQILVQLTGIGAAFIWTFFVALILFKIIDKIMGLRAITIDQQRGLDYTEHYELGYPEFQQDALHKRKE
ncbi:MAG: ammonium transporter [Gammaproteobacteria bacterium]|nr:ammonium transporter [Gammaproteobacteria bacterium]